MSREYRPAARRREEGWLPVSDRIFGHVLGYLEGSRFESRAEPSEAAVHRPLLNPCPPALSIRSFRQGAVSYRPE